MKNILISGGEVYLETQLAEHLLVKVTYFNDVLKALLYAKRIN